MELLVIVVVGAALFAGVVMIVLYRAISNLIDWLILTFGNEESVQRIKDRRGS